MENEVSYREMLIYTVIYTGHPVRPSSTGRKGFSYTQQIWLAKPMLHQGKRCHKGRVSSVIQSQPLLSPLALWLQICTDVGESF